MLSNSFDQYQRNLWYFSQSPTLRGFGLFLSTSGGPRGLYAIPEKLLAFHFLTFYKKQIKKTRLFAESMSCVKRLWNKMVTNYQDRAPRGESSCHTCANAWSYSVSSFAHFSHICVHVYSWRECKCVYCTHKRLCSKEVSSSPQTSFHLRHADHHRLWSSWASLRESHRQTSREAAALIFALRPSSLRFHQSISNVLRQKHQKTCQCSLFCILTPVLFGYYLFLILRNMLHYLHC